MPFSLKSTGSFSRTRTFLTRNRKSKMLAILNRYGELGVEALMAATPKDTGKTAASWYYKIKEEADTTSLVFCNSNRLNVAHNYYNVEDVTVAIVIQYGHATPTGRWIEGIDYINPALQPIFSGLSDEMWKEVALR